MVRLTQPIGFPSPIKNPTSEVGFRVLREPALRGSVLVRRNTRLGYSPLQCYSITPLVLFICRRPRRVSPWTVSAVAPQRSATGWPTGCPSLTSRGRLLTGGVETLIRDSNDEGRVGRRYGTRMKTMTTDPYSGLPSPEVPAKGGSKEAACLMGNVCMRPIYELVPDRVKGCRYFVRHGAKLKYNKGFKTKAQASAWIGQLEGMEWRVGFLFRRKGDDWDTEIVTRMGKPA